MGSLVYFMCSLQWKPELFVHYLLILVLFNCVTALVCMTISTVIRHSTSLANLVAIITLLFFTLFQGAMINFGAAGGRQPAVVPGRGRGTQSRSRAPPFSRLAVCGRICQTRCRCGLAGSRTCRRSALRTTR